MIVKAILIGLLIIFIALAIFLTGYLIGYIHGVYEWEIFIKKHNSHGINHKS